MIYHNEKLVLEDFQQKFQINQPKKVIIGASSGTFDHVSYYKFLLEKSVDDVPHFYIYKDGLISIISDIEEPLSYGGTKDRVGIELESIGYLIQNEKNETIDIFGSIYNKQPHIHRFRGVEKWDGYTNEQINTLNKIIEIFNGKGIPDSLICNDFNWVIFRSNKSITYRDINNTIYK